MTLKETGLYRLLFGWAAALLIKANFRWVSLRSLRGDFTPPKWWQNMILIVLSTVSPRYKHT